MVLVCYPQHPLTRRRSVPLEALRGEPFVAFQAGLKIREEIDRVLALHKVSPRMALEFDNIETIKRAIEIGAGISLLPEPTIAREIEIGTLVQIPIEGEPLVRPLGIIHRRDRKLSETAQQFIQLLQSQATPLRRARIGDANSDGRMARSCDRAKIADSSTQMTQRHEHNERCRSRVSRLIEHRFRPVNASGNETKDRHRDCHVRTTPTSRRVSRRFRRSRGCTTRRSSTIRAAWGLLRTSRASGAIRF